MTFEVPGQGRYIGHFEKDALSMMQMSDCAKLIQAINSLREKRRDGINSCDTEAEAYYELVEGMADVLVCLEQLQETYSIPNHEIQYRIHKKILSQEEKMRELDRSIFEG